MNQFETLDNNLQEKLYIFPTTFYHRLCDTNRTIKAGIDISKLKTSDIQYIGVKNWTKNIDLFKKLMLLIPICENCHWYLIVVIFPGLLEVSMNM